MAEPKASLPEALKSFIDEQVAGDGDEAGDVDELIRDRDRQRLRQMLLDGASSPPAPAAGPAYLEALRERMGGGE